MVSAPIADQLACLSLRLQEIDAARDALLVKIADLDATSQAVQAEYNSILNNAAAIARLPNDILVSIFKEVRGSKNGHLSLGVLTQVTRRWRDVAIGTSKLWSNIIVTKSQGFELCALYLARSRVVPFDLKVSISQEHKDITALAQLLRDHIKRCCRLTIVFQVKTDANIILNTLVSVTAPLLESFDASYQPTKLTQDPYSKNLTKILVGGAPLLTKVRLSGTPCCLPPLDSATSLHLLNVHNASHLSNEQLRDAFLSMKRLTLLEVEGQISLSDAWPHDDEVELPELRTLRIGAHDGQHFASQFLVLYQAIRAPLLQVLSLRNFADDDLVFLSTLPQAGAEPFPNLRALILIDSGATISQFIPIMRAFPKVEEVEIEGNVAALLELLQEADGGSVYWPRLRKLTIRRWVSFQSPIDQPLSRCILSRIATGLPMAELLLPNHAISNALRSISMGGEAILTDLVHVGKYEKEEER